jgi:BlaI family transcriptional regulator, penicillinase repressor
MKELTKAEEQIMQYIWEIEKGVLKDIFKKFPEPKPAYTTISTVIRVLVKKGFIGYKAYGKVHEYFPLVKKPEYFKFYFNRIVKDHFSNSLKKFASFFANENNLSLTELEGLKELVEEKIHEKKAEET